MKLRTKLIVAFLLMSVVPLSVIVLYSYFSSLETLRMAALAEVSELTAEIGDRVETIRNDVGWGVERLGSGELGYLFEDNREVGGSQQFLAELGIAMGSAAPFVESLEFMPLPTAPRAPDSMPAPAPVVVAPAEPEVGAVAENLSQVVESVVIHLGGLADRNAAKGESPEAFLASDEGQALIAEIQVDSAVDGQELATTLRELNITHLMAEAEELREEAGRQLVENRLQQLEQGERVRQERRQVLWVEPMEVGEAATIWEPNLLEPSQVEEMEARELESRRILGREFQSVVERQGRQVGRVKAQISAKKLLQQVLDQAQRDAGEIPFAVDGEGQVYVAREADRALLAGLPLTASDEAPLESSQDLDDWVIVRLQDTESDLIYGIARPIGQSLTKLRRTAGRNFAIGLGIVGLALVGIAPLSRRITRDLGALTEGAEKLATGDLNSRVPVRSRDEVGHLARTFNQMAEDLQRNQQRLLEEEKLRKEHELERRLLAAENSRKSDELEAARRFQLSLLPKRLPDHPDLEIGVFMKTATEVGGDYYDFHLASSAGPLTTAIGDATGHGAMAGTMVTVIKSLFAAEAGTMGLAPFLDKASQSIRRMELGRMAMALTLARYQEGRLRVAAAGMPPVLIHRSSSQNVDELALEGVPLGSMGNASYQECQVDVAAGDTVLLMTDGFPELTNDKGEPLGYVAVRNLFAAHGSAGPKQLIGELADAAAAWSGDSSPNDDITFVVIQVKG